MQKQGSFIDLPYYLEIKAPLLKDNFQEIQKQARIELYFDEKLRLQICDKLRKAHNEVFHGDKTKVYKFKFSICDDKNNNLVDIVTSDYEGSWIGWTEYKCKLSNIERNSVIDKAKNTIKYFWSVIKETVQQKMIGYAQKAIKF